MYFITEVLSRLCINSSHSLAVIMIFLQNFFFFFYFKLYFIQCSLSVFWVLLLFFYPSLSLSLPRSHFVLFFGIWIWNFGGLIGYSICMDSIRLCGWRNAFECDFGVYTYFERLVSICRHSFAFSLSGYSCSISYAHSLTHSRPFSAVRSLAFSI